VLKKRFSSFWSLNSFWQGFTVASSLIGTVFGSLLAGYPAQKYGRKKIINSHRIDVSLICYRLRNHSIWMLFILFRFIGGLAVGASSVVGPMYISEISPAKIRGRLAGSFQVNIVTGILIAYFANFLLSGIGENSWRWMLGIMAVPATIFAILVIEQFREGPRWLVLNGRDDEAKKIFEKNRRA
jgi:MFS family permease